MFLLLLITTVCAWGKIGHKITGIIAQNYLSPTALKLVKQIIEPSYNGNLELVAVWADEHKSGSYAFSSGFHFVNTKDSQFKQNGCSFDDQRDCPNDDCVSSAISNYTQRLDCTKNKGLDSTQIREALYFLAHFVGDITQPLHNCGRSNGGSLEKAVFDRRKVNMHTLWDTTMISKNLQNNYKGSTDQYAADLIKKIDKREKGYERAQDWIKSIDTQYNRVNSLGHWVVPISWSKGTNGINCQFVWPAYDLDKSKDLSTDYYVKAIKIIDVQLAMAGYRLAALLNKALVNCPIDRFTVKSLLRSTEG